MKLSTQKITLVTSVLLSVLALTGCDKADKTTTTTTTASTATTSTQTTTSVAPASTTTTVTTTTTTSNVSPTAQVWIDSTKIATVMMLSQSNPKITAEQKACLTDASADAAYATKAQAEINRILSPEDQKKSDEFYSSALGKKIVAMTHQQLKQAMGEPATTPITLTAEEQKEMVTFTQSGFAQKMQADTAKMTQQQAEAMIKEIADKEKVRCKIA